MSVRFVEKAWGRELEQASQLDSSHLRIACPFIKLGALNRLLASRPARVQVITRFNLADFARGVSDIAALWRLLDAGSEVRGIRGLHAKLYVFGASRAVVSSANLTGAALYRNHEFGLVAEDPALIEACVTYFDDLWARAKQNLSSDMLDDWSEIVARHRATGGRPGPELNLPDFGVKVGLEANALPTPEVYADAEQGFVKFFGEGHKRAAIDWPVGEALKASDCHWAVAYPAKKRPRSVREGAAMFTAWLTRDPHDIRVFGRGVGTAHVEGRDDASAEEIERHPWKAGWPRYIRIHHAKFVAGSLANGVSLNEMMEELGADAFASTQKNKTRGGNIDPRRAYQRQAAVELTQEGIAWMNERLHAAFERHGTVPQDDLDALGWPEVDLEKYEAVPEGPQSVSTRGRGHK